MAEDVGELLELLENRKLAKVYRSRIRQMQPADLVRRLESEKVSTRGHMPELRGRLLRLEARKLGLKVPWYNEDDQQVAASKKVQQDQARTQCAKGPKSTKKTTVLVKNECAPNGKRTRRKDTVDRTRRNETKGYTERVLKGAAEALNKMLNSITDKDFFESMAMIRSIEKRPKTKSYIRLNEID